MIRKWMHFGWTRRANASAYVFLLALPLLLLSGCFDFLEDDPELFTPQELKALTPPMNEVYESEIMQERYYRVNYSTCHLDSSEAYVQKRVQEGWEDRGIDYMGIPSSFKQSLRKVVSGRRVDLIVRCRFDFEDTGSSLSVSN